MYVFFFFLLFYVTVLFMFFGVIDPVLPCVAGQDLTNRVDRRTVLSAGLGARWHNLQIESSGRCASRAKRKHQ